MELPRSPICTSYLILIPKEELQRKLFVRLRGSLGVLQRDPDKLLKKARIENIDITLNDLDKKRLKEFVRKNEQDVEGLLKLRGFSVIPIGLRKLREGRTVNRRIEEVRGRLLVLAFNEGMDAAKTMKGELIEAGLMEKGSPELLVDKMN